jgi:hypothetical protein
LKSIPSRPRLILLQASLLHNDGRRISLRDGYKEAHEEIVNNGENSMPVPRGNDRRSWRRKTPKKQSVSVYLIHAVNIGGFLRNGLNSQVLATQEIAYSLKYVEYLQVQRALSDFIAELNGRPGCQIKLRSRIELNLLWAE